jgi:glycosyltransferase involved in cell wall biosynthesis
MALGKPVVCYIHDSLLSTYPEGFPIVNANPDTIESVLEELLLSPQKRHDIGIQSREYAEGVHDIKVVAKRLEKIYLGATK